MDELVNARVWVGFHFRNSDIVGKEVGRKISRFALSHFLRVVGDDASEPEAGSKVSSRSRGEPGQR